MTTERKKPHLTLIAGDATLEQYVLYIEQLTGEEMTPDEIEELRKGLADDGAATA